MKIKTEPPLRASPDPEKIFRQGEAFLEAMTLLVRCARPANQAQLGAPIVVNSAFASEIFLKCLIRLESGQTARGHHLDALFARLHPATRQEIDALWREGIVRKEQATLRIEAAMGITIPRKLQDCLAAGGRAFEATRYLYEGDGKVRFVLTDLPKMLHEVILARRPEWSQPLPEPRLIEEMQFQKPST
ncbi:hypothetical protein MKK58_13690 [Methylobacterium sp. J-078]|uniref:hypothetical protein n=1 Tax=Methylobacterium sp. J-078 TaxID=2836657 RepID=UPI001FBB480E|nr:hypothetical protein [Methylobacterium sp. J-078]MCJ2045577.1 hypothetical protein [Methylobacterium sp. J-078]